MLDAAEASIAADRMSSEPSGTYRKVYRTPIGGTVIVNFKDGEAVGWTIPGGSDWLTRDLANVRNHIASGYYEVAHHRHAAMTLAYLDMQRADDEFDAWIRHNGMPGPSWSDEKKAEHDRLMRAAEAAFGSYQELRHNTQ